jgi:drug/metabolite transporter (DMT)-like permease
MAWSVAVILYQKSGDRVPLAALNLFKNLFATLLFFLTVLVLGESAPEGIDWRHYAILLGSGILGVGVADLFFLMCLKRIGAGRQAIVSTAYSPPIIFLSWLFLGESLTGMQLLGVTFILGAVLAVGMTREADGSEDFGRLRSGVFWGVAACFVQAISILMVKPFLAEWPLLWTTAWRMMGGLLSTVVMIALAKKEERTLAPFRQSSTWKVLLPAIVIGSYISLILWMAGFKYTDASIAAPLNQTSTLFTFILAAILLHEPVTLRRVGGLVLGLMGIALVTFFGG